MLTIFTIFTNNLFSSSFNDDVKFFKTLPDIFLKTQRTPEEIKSSISKYKPTNRIYKFIGSYYEGEYETIDTIKYSKSTKNEPDRISVVFKFYTSMLKKITNNSDPILKSCRSDEKKGFFDYTFIENDKTIKPHNLENIFSNAILERIKANEKIKKKLS